MTIKKDALSLVEKSQKKATAKVLLNMQTSLKAILEDMAPAPMPTAPQAPAQQSMGAGGSPVSVDGQPLTIDSLIDRLNIIRGGKSFNKPEVYGKLDGWYKTIDPSTKQIMDRMLNDIGKAMIDADEENPQPQPQQDAPPPPPPAQTGTPTPQQMAPAAPSIAPSPV